MAELADPEVRPTCIWWRSGGHWPERERPRHHRWPVRQYAPGPARAGPSFAQGGPHDVPVLATYFSVRRGRDPFFKFFMRTIFPRQVKDYEEKFGIRFIGWYNVAYGWDFDNVILLDLPDYATIDKLEKDEAHPRTRPSRRRVDLRTPPLDVPARADGTRSRVPPVDSPDSTEATNGRPQRPARRARGATPPSNAPISSSRRPSSCASSSTPTGADRELGGLTLIDEEPDYLSIAPDLTLPQPQPLPGRGHRRVGQRDRGHRERRRSSSSSTTRPTSTRRSPRRPARRRAARRADRRGRPASRPPASRPRRPSRSARTRTPPPPTRGPPARASPSTPTTTRPPPIGCTTSRSSTRSAASAARRACSRSSRAPRPG